jgi:hypothetical protein
MDLDLAVVAHSFRDTAGDLLGVSEPRLVDNGGSHGFT